MDLTWKIGLKAKPGDVIFDLGQRYRLLLPVDGGLTRHCKDADKKFYEYLGPVEAVVVKPTPATTAPTPAAPTPAVPAKPSYEELEARLINLATDRQTDLQLIAELTQRLNSALDSLKQQQEKAAIAIQDIKPQ